MADESRSDMRTMNMPRRRGFTLLELMAVILIVALLISLLLPAVQQAREAARRTSCRNNLHQLGIALANYQMTHGLLPPGCISRPGYEGQPEEFKRLSWVTQILPFIEQKGLHQMINFEVPEQSFMSREEVQKYRKVRDLWIELRTLQGLPLNSTPELGELQGIGGEMSGDDPAVAEDSVPQSDESPPAEPSAETATNGDEVRKAARRLELETELANLGYPNLDQMPSLPLQSLSSIYTSTKVAVLHCPSSPNNNISYAGSHHSSSKPISNDADGMFYVDSSESLRVIPDGATNTILLGEHTSNLAAGWFYGDGGTLRNGGRMTDYASRNTAANPGGLVSDFSQMSPDERVKYLESLQQIGPFGSFHSFDQVNMLFADGSVRALAGDLNPEALAHMVSRNDGF